LYAAPEALTAAQAPDPDAEKALQKPGAKGNVIKVAGLLKTLAAARARRTDETAPRRRVSGA